MYLPKIEEICEVAVGVGQRTWLRNEIPVSFDMKKNVCVIGSRGVWHRHF